MLIWRHRCCSQRVRQRRARVTIWVFYVYANIDVCAREPKSEQETHVCNSERLLQHVHMCEERERERGVEMIRSVMLQTAVNVMQPRVNFSWHLWFLVATHTQWIFSSDRLSPRLSAIPIKTTCWWRKHGCWMKYDEFMHWNTTKRILGSKLIFSICIIVTRGS